MLLWEQHSAQLRADLGLFLIVEKASFYARVFWCSWGERTMTAPPSPTPLIPAPEISVSQWLNTDQDLSLAGLSGEVVVIEAFQMLCPGCVSHGLPQAQRVASTFGDDVVIIGLHTVFEHHDAMLPVSLKAFLYEYRISFPVGVDAYDRGDPTPITMRRYGLRGTPTLLAIDRGGHLRIHAFGQVDDLVLGAGIARLIDETYP